MKYLARRRSVLIAPGSDERKARKALASQADEVILDLEDAVTADNKVYARELVCSLITEGTRSGSIAVRVNGLNTPWARADLAACAAVPHLDNVVLPKAESAADIEAVDEALSGTDLGIQALIETPAGVENLSAIANAGARMEALVLGYADLGAALGRAHTAAPELWLALQDRLLVTARAAGIAAIDGPYFDTKDSAGLSEASRWTRNLGFDGKWAIHPGQIDTISNTFTPADTAIAEAHRTLGVLREAATRGYGAAQVDGTMVDEAVAVAARRTLARAGISQA